MTENINVGDVTKNKTPLGVKIISVLIFLVSLLVLYVVTIGFNSLNVQEVANNTPNLNLPSNFFSVVNIIGVIFSVILMILGLFFWRRANWARVSIIVILAFGIILSFPVILMLFLLGGPFAIIFFLFGFIPLILALSVLFYLIFNKKIRVAFNSGELSKSIKIFVRIFATIFTIILIMIGLSYYGDEGPLTNYSAEESNNFIGNTVYENTHYKFKLTYPENSVVRPTQTQTGYIIRFFLPNGKTLANDQENVGIYIKENIQDLEKFIQAEKERYSKNGKLDIQEVKIGGQKGYKMIFVSDYTVNKGTREASYITVNNNTLYMINYFPVVDENIKTVDNLVNSLEFIK